MQPDNSTEELPAEKLAIIEPHLGTIAHIKHRDLDIEIGRAGFRDGQAFDPKQILTSPGNIRLRTETRGRYRIKPQVEFFAEPGGKYLLSSVCVSTRFSRKVREQFIVIVDANSQNIIATDDFCPDCEALIGTPLSQWPCNNRFGSLNSQSLIAYHFGLASLRIICDAAERRVTSARVRLGYIYESGYEGFFDEIRRDPFLSYYWFKMAAQQEGDDVFIEKARYLPQRVKGELTSDQIAEADQLIQNHKRGTCESQLFGAYTCVGNCMRHIENRN